MTGIERLREFVSGISTITELSVVTKTSYDREHMEEVGVRLRDFLDDIADQIERELDEDCYRMGLDHGAVSRTVSDMERHILGHEGMEDSPVARWARELREAMGGDGRFQKSRKVANSLTSHSDASDVSMSAYDLLPQEERDAIAWVRKHGGIDHVRAEWSSRVPYDRYERRRQSLLGHIAECETALGRRNKRIEDLGRTVEFFQLNNSNFRHLLADVAERLGFTRYGDDYEPEDLLDALDRRLMPEGMEWPRYEDGEPVELGDEVSARTGGTFAIGSVTLRDDSFALNASWYDRGERVKRPAVPAADGEPLEAGQTVYNVGSSEERVVDHIEYEGGGTPNVYYADGGWDYPDLITHQRPVLDANGVPINKGDTVYLLPGEWCDEFPCLGFHGGEELEVFADGEDFYVSGTVQCRDKEKTPSSYGTCYPQPSQLTHTKHEPPDSRRAVVNEIGDEMAARIDLLVSSGRWSDAD